MLTPEWTKPLESQSGGNCFLARVNGDRVEVSDTKVEGTPVLASYTIPEWEAMLAAVKRGQYDLPA